VTDWKGAAAPGVRPQPDDDATRAARHEVLATLLGAYADGELPPETMTQVEAHLLGCDRCRREVQVQQALADQLGTLAAALPSPALLARVASITATMPPAPLVTPTPRAWGGPRRWVVAVASLLVVSVASLVWQRQSARTSEVAAPVELTALPAVVAAVTADYRATSARDLPGRARDLETVRAAVSFPVQPLIREELRLVGAWTEELDGELAAVLAYRWHDKLVVQYTLSDAALFRAVDLRRAFAAGQAVGVQDGAVGVVGWVAPQGGSLLVGEVSWRTLRDVQRDGQRDAQPAAR
jgi:anti-sigma factor RsiW